MSAASVNETRQAIDSALRARGGAYSTYSCKTISWDDVSRGTVSGEVSCWGANITDTYLNAKDGTSLFTVRPDNWNERLGSVRAEDVAILVGNCDDDNCDAQHPPPLRNVTLLDFLSDPHECGAAYSGLAKGTDLSAAEADGSVSIRFQTVFLPVPDDTKATSQFATEAYNYNTTSDEHPRNLVMLCTTQGIAVQADGKGRKRLLHHARKEAGQAVRKFWLEAERSRHNVGGPQEETHDERSDALSRGKAVADTLGLRAMGTRFNVLMTVQIPLVTPPQTSMFSPSFFSVSSALNDSNAYENVPTFGTASAMQTAAPAYAARIALLEAELSASCGTVGSASTFGETPFVLQAWPNTLHRRNNFIPLGASNAARVSRGSDAGLFTPLQMQKVERRTTEHVTVTVVMYNTVAGGVPKEADVIAAIDDMENLLKACTKEGRLSNAAFDFMKKPLAIDDIHDIATKVVTQPPCSAHDHTDQSAWGTSAVGVTQQERDEVEHALVALHQNPSESTITAARLVALGALGNASPTVVDSLRTGFHKLESLRTDAGIASQAFKNQRTMVVLMTRGALADHFV